MPILAQDIIDAGLDRIEVLLEHQLTLTSKRVDVIIAGRHPETGSASYVLVELTQWSQATPDDLTGELVTVQGVPGGPRLHPGARSSDSSSALGGSNGRGVSGGVARTLQESRQS